MRFGGTSADGVVGRSLGAVLDWERSNCRGLAWPAQGRDTEAEQSFFARSVKGIALVAEQPRRAIPAGLDFGLYCTLGGRRAHECGGRTEDAGLVASSPPGQSKNWAIAL